MKKFKVLMFACSAFLSVPAVQALEWEKWHNVYTAFNGVHGDNRSVDFLNEFERLSGTYAILGMDMVNTGTRVRLCDPNWRQAHAYFSLPKDVQDILQRIGLVAYDGQYFNFTRSLSVTYLVYPSMESARILHCKGIIWLTVALKLLALSEGQVTFVRSFDMSDGALHVRSLPNDFLLREYSADMEPWLDMQIIRNNANEPFAFASVLVPPSSARIARYTHDGRVQVIIHVIAPQGFHVQGPADIERVLSHFTAPGEHSCLSPMSFEQIQANLSLCNAAEAGDVDRVRTLLDSGMACIAPTELYTGCTVLHIAAKNGRTDVMRILLQKIEQEQMDTLDGTETPFHLAVDGEHADTVQILLDHMTPEQRKWQLEDIKKELTVLMFIAMRGNLAIVDILLKAMTLEQVQIRDGDGMMALHLAAECGHADVVMFLIEKLITLGMSQEGVTNMLKNLTPSQDSNPYENWVAKVRKFPGCVQILKPYIPEL
jgi:ankyrin repeat protein